MFRGLVWVRHRCEQGTPGVLPGERWEGFYLGEEVGGQPPCLLGDLEVRILERTSFGQGLKEMREI